jgi:membrane protein required for beta-lactamase induction
MSPMLRIAIVLTGIGAGSAAIHKLAYHFATKRNESHMMSVARQHQSMAKRSNS